MNFTHDKTSINNVRLTNLPNIYLFHKRITKDINKNNLQYTINAWLDHGSNIKLPENLINYHYIYVFGTANLFTFTAIIENSYIHKKYKIQVYYNSPNNYFSIKTVKSQQYIQFNKNKKNVFTQIHNKCNNILTCTKENIQKVQFHPRVRKEYLASLNLKNNSRIYKNSDPIKEISIPALELAFQVQQQIAPPQIKITQLTADQIAKLEKNENAKASVDAKTLAAINNAKSTRIAAMKPSSADASQPTDGKEIPSILKNEEQTDEISQLTERSINEYINTRNIPQLIKFKDTAGIPGIKPDQLNPDN